MFISSGRAKPAGKTKKDFQRSLLNIIVIGGDTGTRTLDLFNAIEAL
jgi:hypothetical protein